MISYGEAVQRNIGTLVIDSPWLRDAGVELHEITSELYFLALYPCDSRLIYRGPARVQRETLPVPCRIFYAAT
jgi:hypothetical protein